MIDNSFSLCYTMYNKTNEGNVFMNTKIYKRYLICYENGKFCIRYRSGRLFHICNTEEEAKQLCDWLHK